MLAVALCFGIFAYWTVVGYAIVSSLHAGGTRVQQLLLSPAIGLAATVICLFGLSRAGLPVWTFGIPVTVILLLGAALVLWRTRPGIDARRAWPFALVLVLAFVATAKPMFKYGFDWVSYCNDDMANYSLAGDRFYYNSYEDPPKIDELVRGKYYASDFWYIYTSENARPGSELTLAWAKSLTRLNEHQTFMPLTVSYHLGLICGAAGLVMAGAGVAGARRAGEPLPAGEDVDESRTAEGTRRRSGGGRLSRAIAGLDGLVSPALLTAFMMALSALVSLGTLYQLIAQVAGLGLLAVNAALLLRPFRDLSGARLARHAVLLGIAGSGLLLMYPEVVPFLALAWIGFLLVGLVRRRIGIGGTSVAVGLAAVVAIVLTRKYFFSVVSYLLTQVRNSAGRGDDPQTTLFPFYMLPEGLGDFWGFFRIAAWEPDPYQSRAIAAGAILIGLGILATIWLCWRHEPVAFVLAIMIPMGVLLFRQRSGFGLYKLAMYCQPFLLGTMVLAWSLLIRRRLRWRTAGLLATVLPFLVLAYFGRYGQGLYVAASEGRGSTLLEIRDASALRIGREFRGIVARHQPQVIISDAYNVVIAKFQSLYTRGRNLVLPSSVFFNQIDTAHSFHWSHLTPEQAQISERLYQARLQEQLFTRPFDVQDPADPELTTSFYIIDLGYTAPGRGGDALLVMTTPQQSVINRRHFPPDLRQSFVAVPYAQAQDHLIFLSCDLGVPYYLFGSRHLTPAIYQLESDPMFFRGDTFAAVGRYLLFQAIHPTEKARLVLNLTCTYQGDGENVLPPVAAVGDGRQPLPVVGRGSMRIVSPPLEFREIDGRKYVLLDMGTFGHRLGLARTGLMNWFGHDVAIDRRVVVGFARDIALISDEDYQKLTPPSAVNGFPWGRHNPLRNPELEYSGLYEDGWAGEDVMIRLTQPAGAKTFVLKGKLDERLAPKDHRAAVELTIDDQPVSLSGQSSPPATAPATQPTASAAEGSAFITRGEFTLRGDVPPAASDQVHTLRVRFKGPLLHLDQPDGRPVSAQLDSLGFEMPPARIDGFGPGSPGKVNPVHNREFEMAGVWEDGWTGAESSFRVTQPAGMRTLVIQGHVPKVEGSEAHESGVEVLIDDQPAPVTVQQLSGATTGLSGGNAGPAKVRVGAFAIRAQLPAVTKDQIHRVRLRFKDPLLRLPQPDTRSVGAQLSFVAFEPGTSNVK